MKLMIVLAALLIITYAGGLYREVEAPPTLPAEAHASVPQGVELVTASVGSDNYAVYYIEPIDQKRYHDVVVTPDEGYYITKAGIRYSQVLVLHGEFANIRRVSDSRVVSAVKVGTSNICGE